MSIQRGLGAIADANKGSAAYLKLKDGESTVVRFLQPTEEIVSVWEYSIQIDGKWRNVTALPKGECPLYAAGKKPSFKSYLLVYDFTDQKVKIFKANKDVGKSIIGLVEEYGDLTARDFKILRQGEKINTTYQFFAKDKSEFDFDAVSENIPNVEEMVKPMTRDAIIAMMAGMDAVTDANPNTNETAGGGKKDDFPF
jgi:hypothetical protein